MMYSLLGVCYWKSGLRTPSKEQPTVVYKGATRRRQEKTAPGHKSARSSQMCAFISKQRRLPRFYESPPGAVLMSSSDNIDSELPE
jgi:hypothetical protein